MSAGGTPCEIAALGGFPPHAQTRTEWLVDHERTPLGACGNAVEFAVVALLKFGLDDAVAATLAQLAVGGASAVGSVVDAVVAGLAVCGSDDAVAATRGEIGAVEAASII